MPDDSLAPGLYETPIGRLLRSRIEDRQSDGWRVSEEAPDSTGRAELLARAVYDAAMRAFSAGDEARIVRLANRALEVLDQATRDRLEDPASVLTEVAAPQRSLANQEPLVRPTLSLRESGLLVNSHRDVQLSSELAKEIASADRVDLLCAFVRFTGVRLIRRELAELTRRGGKLRVITSVYTGTTERKALDELVRLGAEVRVSYETGTTRLHAKAWLLHRDSGFSSAFVGSSNLTQAALVDGLEWNVRLAETDNGPILERFRATFEQYWAEPEFKRYDPAKDGETLERALRREGFDRRGDSDALAASLLSLGLEWEAKPHQAAALDALRAERDAGHMRNLVVAATGTGKTWIAAFDYARERAMGDRLLFVAHREEILSQSLLVFRLVVGDGNFGELLVGGSRPVDGRHVFASIQSLQSRVDEIDPGAYDFVVVDEFHHAAAPTYDRLIDRLQPRILLGLTATPERADGKSILDWFDGRIATETRLWDALEQGLLVPFHYFGIPDGSVDLSSLSFNNGQYDQEELGNLLTGNEMRAHLIRRAIADYVANPETMRALGFCASVRHAEFMAEAFTSAGMAAVTVHGGTRDDDRHAAVQRLRRGELRAVFTVDVFNEGVDIPEVDTVLLLRPTESATIFLQQLGRGLRHAPQSDKSVLTVLDFVGQAHRDYRYEVRYAALLGRATRLQVQRAIENDFPHLPPGCAIKFEPVAKETVLGHLRQLAQRNRRLLVDELRALGPGTTLHQYLVETGTALEDIYAGGGGSFTGLTRRAGFAPVGSPEERPWERALARLLHVDDRERIDTWRRWLGVSESPTEASMTEREQRLWRMLLAALGRQERTPRDLDVLWRSPLRRELGELLVELSDRIRRIPEPLNPGTAFPLASHGTYGRDEVLAAFNDTRADGSLTDVREDVRWVESSQTDVFFVTLEKSEREFSPTTRYADYPISPSLFQWESQSTTSVRSATGSRYIGHSERGTKVMLFVRERRQAANGVTLPYLNLGYARYVSHERDRPIRILWQLERPMPPELFETAKVAAG